MTAATPERLLWLAVVEQAFLDATSESEDVRERQAREAATLWLLEDSDAFKYVCGLAGLEASSVRLHFTEGRVDVDMLRRFARIRG